MYTELNQQISKAKEGMKRLDKIDRMLNSLSEELKDLEDKEFLLRKAKEKEEKEYHDLLKGGIQSIFYRILGSDEKHLEKEKQEALAASLKYQQCLYDIEQIKSQRDILYTERKEVACSKEDYEKLYQEKKGLVSNSHSEYAEQIMELTDKLAECKANEKEIDEAINVGNQVLSSIECTMESLNHARDWGTWDLLGGGFISDMAKHSHIDDAESSAEMTQSLLRKFKTELTDVNITDDLRIDIGDFAKFADFFFDGLIADWCMQSKIDNSLDSTLSVKNKVDRVMNQLNRLKNSIQSRERDYTNQMDILILNA